jgi:hypothetical protein
MGRAAALGRYRVCAPLLFEDLLSRGVVSG